MTAIHKKAEYLFTVMATWVCKHKFIAMATMLFITALLAGQLPKLTIDVREESFFHENDPTLTAYNNFRDQFGQDDMFIIGLRPQDGFTAQFFATLDELHTQLEEAVPYLDEVTSLVNGRVVRAQKDTLKVEDLIPRPPEDKRELDRILKLIDHYPLYENLLISPDRSLAAILIKAQAVVGNNSEDIMDGFESNAELSPDTPNTYLSNEQYVEINTVIRSILKKFKHRGIEFYLAGNPAFVSELQEGLETDMARMIPLSFLVIIIFLSIVFRKVTGVIYPLITVIFSLISSIGIMAAWGLPITNVIQILPTFLIVVGIGDSVHILTLFYRYYRLSGDKKDAVIKAVGYAGLPVFMTSVTTACGLLSFIWADVAVIAQLGYIAPIGVMLAFLYTLILLPALIAAFPVKKISPSVTPKRFSADRLFDAIAHLTTRRPLLVTVAYAVIVALSVAAALTVRFSHNAMTWLPKESLARRSTEILDQKNGGTIALEVIVDSGKPNGLYDPDLLARMDQAGKVIPTFKVHHIKTGKVIGPADVLKETHRALHQDSDKFYTVPTSRQLIAQELILFESSGSDDLQDFTDSTYQKGRLTILAPFTDSILYKDYTDKIKAYLKDQFPHETVTLTGHMALFIGITKLFITTMAKSYIFALIVISVLMVIMIGRIKVGLMSMIANITPIVMVFAIMAVADIPLDLFTILIGSIVLGLVVDDTIHFLHHFRNNFERTGSVENAVQETLHSTGRALTITSLVLCGGFLIYTISFLSCNVYFGILTASAVLFALAADFLLVPSLLTFIYGDKETAFKAPGQFESKSYPLVKETF